MKKIPRINARRRLPWFLVLAIIALAIPAVAFAWSQTYAAGIFLGPDGQRFSSFNSNLNYNFVSWYGYPTGPTTMQLSLCNSGGSCHAYTESTAGTLTDTRSISYGRAKCHSKSTSFYDSYIYNCYTHN